MKKKVTAPLSYDPGKGRPKEHLAYLNWQEMQQLQRLNGGNMELGPRGLPSFPPADAIGSSSRASSSGSYGGGGRDTGGRGNVGMGKTPSSPRGDVGGRGGPGGNVLSSPVRSIPSVAGRGVDSRGRSVSEVAASIRKDVNTRIAAAKLAEERSNRDVAAKRAAEAANARSLRGIPAVKDDIRKAAEGPAFGSRFGTQIQGTISGLAALPSSVRVGPAAYSPAPQGVYGPRAAYDPSRIGQYASPQKQFTEKVPRYIDKVPFSAREPEAFRRTPTGLGNVMSRGPLGYARGLQAEAQWQAGFNPPVRSEIPSKSADVKKDISRAIGSAYGAPPRPTGPLAQRPTTPAREDRPFTEIAPPPAPPAERTKMFYDRIESGQVSGKRFYDRILEQPQGQPYKYGSISAPATGTPQVDQPRLNVTGGMGFLPIQSSLPSAPSRRISTSATLEQKNRLYGSAPIKLSDDTGDLGKTRGLTAEDVQEPAQSIYGPVYVPPEVQKIMKDQERKNRIAFETARRGAAFLGPVGALASLGVYAIDKGTKFLTGSDLVGLSTEQKRAYLQAHDEAERQAIIEKNPAILGFAKSIGDEITPEQAQAYRDWQIEREVVPPGMPIPGQDNTSYAGRTPFVERGGKVDRTPAYMGGGPSGPASGVPQPVTTTTSGRPYIYYQWDVGVNIPSPGDPNYTSYQEYLRRRAQAQA